MNKGIGCRTINLSLLGLWRFLVGCNGLIPVEGSQYPDLLISKSREYCVCSPPASVSIKPEDITATNNVNCSVRSLSEMIMLAKVLRKDETHVRSYVNGL